MHAHIHSNILPRHHHDVPHQGTHARQPSILAPGDTLQSAGWQHLWCPHSPSSSSGYGSGVGGANGTVLQRLQSAPPLPLQDAQSPQEHPLACHVRGGPHSCVHSLLQQHQIKNSQEDMARAPNTQHQDPRDCAHSCTCSSHHPGRGWQQQTSLPIITIRLGNSGNLSHHHLHPGWEQSQILPAQARPPRSCLT